MCKRYIQKLPKMLHHSSKHLLLLTDTTDGFVDMSIWLAFRDAIALVTPYEDIILDGEPSPAGTLLALTGTAVVSSMTAADGRILIASSTLPYMMPTNFSVHGWPFVTPGWRLCNLVTK
eukprot:SAG11_NODE_362_length_10182_cov_9.886641_11_plen_118_part_01